MKSELLSIIEAIEKLPLIVSDLTGGGDYIRFYLPNLMLDFEITLWDDDDTCWEVHWWNDRYKQGQIGWEYSRFVDNPEQVVSVINSIIKEFT